MYIYTNTHTERERFELGILNVQADFVADEPFEKRPVMTSGEI